MGVAGLAGVEDEHERVEARVRALPPARGATHVLLHAPEGDGVASNVAEVEAESVAYVVCQAAGMAATDYSLPYLARWSRGDVGLITATTERVLTTARTVLAGLDIDAAAGDPSN